MNEEFKIQDNGEIEVQISPIGSFNGSTAKGEPIPENITSESLNQLAEELNSSGKEILVDVDHASVRAGLDRDTKAVGWLSRFWTNTKGLFAKMKLTNTGKDLVQSRTYRFLSPVFALNSNGEPSSLHSVAFTNTPAFAGRIDPIVNHSAKEDLTLNQEKDVLNMTKEELIQLIKDTVKAGEVEEEMKEEVTEVPVENAEPVKEEEVKTEEQTVVEQPKVEQPKVDETKKQKDDEDETKEVIKIEALNSAPSTSVVDFSSKSQWENLKGKAFFDYVKAHPGL